jgi:hypothetical protein
VRATRWTKAELDARIAAGPSFSYPGPTPADVDDLATRYEAVTSERLVRRKGLNMLAAAYRVHGPDTVAFLADLFDERGSTVNLLGILRCSPPRAGRHAPSASDQQPIQSGPTRPDGDIRPLAHTGPPCPTEVALPDVTYCGAHRPLSDPASTIRYDRRPAADNSH